MLPAMNSVVGGKMRKIEKRDLVSEITYPLKRIKQNPLKHEPEAADPVSSLFCTMTKADLVQLYPTLSSNF